MEDILQKFMADIHDYARLIDAPEHALPKLFDDGSYECLWVEIDAPMPVYSYLYREREDTELLTRSGNKDVVLERIFSDVTFSMAIDYEVAHRIEGQDFRRQLFAVEENLMRRLKAVWGDNSAERHAEILKENPFVDKNH